LFDRYWFQRSPLFTEFINVSKDFIHESLVVNLNKMVENEVVVVQPYLIVLYLGKFLDDFVGFL